MIPVTPGRGQGKPFVFGNKIIEKHMMYKSLLTLMLTLDGYRIARTPKGLWKSER